jgi:type IV pilus assembly protein PilC
VVFDEASELLMRDIAQGQALSQAMSGLQLYPPMVLQLCAVGEASGTLDEMLAKAADFLDVQVQTRLASLMSLLEPALMVVLGSLIGGMVVAMYLPIFNMGQVI